MRPKVVITVLLLAFGLLGVVVLVSKKTGRATGPGSGVEEHATLTNTAPPVETVVSPKTEPVVSMMTASVAPAPVAVTNHAAYVEKRNAELMALAMNNDAASMETILSELHNPDRQIRKGALEAIQQFDDRAAIPRLKEIAAQTQDEEEKAEILEAADFLALPSLSEYIAQQQAQRQAMGLTNQAARPRPNRLTNSPRPRPQPVMQVQPSAPPPQSAP